MGRKDRRGSGFVSRIFVYVFVLLTFSHQVDTIDIATRSGIERELIAKKVSQWELDDLIESKASIVRHVGNKYIIFLNLHPTSLQRYTITGNIPKTHEEIGKVAKQMHERMLVREQEAVDKLHKVISFGSGAQCETYHPPERTEISPYIPRPCICIGGPLR